MKQARSDQILVSRQVVTPEGVAEATFCHSVVSRHEPVPRDTQVLACRMGQLVLGSVS